MFFCVSHKATLWREYYIAYAITWQKICHSVADIVSIGMPCYDIIGNEKGCYYYKRKRVFTIYKRNVIYVKRGGKRLEMDVKYMRNR